MCKLFVKVTLLLSLFTFSFADNVALKGAETGKWTMDVEAAYSLAKEKKLPILMNFTGSDWCYWCQVMDQNVFSKPEWANYTKNKWVLVLIDFPSNQDIVPENYKERNDLLAREFNVKGYPTYIVMNHKQEIIGELGSGQDKTPKSFSEELKTVVNLSEDGIESTLEKLSAQQQAEYKRLLEEYQQANNAMGTWLNTGPDRTDENIAKYKEFIKQLEKIEAKLRKYW